MPRTMFELEERIADLRMQISTEADGLVTMATDAGAKMDDVRAKQQRVKDLQERLAVLETERAKMAEKAKGTMGAEGEAMSRQEAAGMFYRAAMMGQMDKLPRMAYEQLGAKPAGNADQGSGSKLLPTTLANELLLEPQVTNPLRGRMMVTNIPGLKLPKLGFAVDNDSFISKDGETAKELKLSGDTVDFGRYELPLKATVSESLLRSTPLNIEAAVNAGLESAQAAKELKVIFAENPTSGEEHMSLYAKDSGGSTYLCKAVEGADLLDAILAAAGDLEDVYQAGACVVMRRQDYYGFIRSLANAEALFGRKPEDVIGYPVIFCEKATIPVVGDFRYLHLNYDGDTYFDTDKDVTKRLRYFTCNAEYDIHVVLRAAFRLAKVAAAEDESP